MGPRRPQHPGNASELLPGRAARRPPRRACGECARRKHACTGGTPAPGDDGGAASQACSACELRGSPCIFPAAAAAPEPRPANSPSPAQRPPTLVPVPATVPQPPASAVEEPAILALTARLGSLHNAVGRVAPLTPAAVRGEPASPLLWAALWGIAVADGQPAHNAAAIGIRARELLLAGLERTGGELALHAADGEAPRSAAGSAVAVLHALLLATLGAERAGSRLAMVGLASLALRFARLAAMALSGWIGRTRALLFEDRGATSAADSDIDALEAWMAARDFVSPFPAADSLCYSLPRPHTLRSMDPDSKHDVILLARFSACFFYCAGIEIWASELIGTAAVCTGPVVAHVPVPFDTKHIGDGSFDGLTPVYLNPVVSTGSFGKWCLPATDADHRASILRATITDAFRVGSHFLFTVHNDILSHTWALRRHALAAGHVRLYPDACEADPAVRTEMERLSALLSEVYGALPPELLAMVQQGRVADLLEAHGSGPAFAEQPIAAWMIFYFEYQATLFAPPPDADPPPGWHAHPDGIRSGASAVLAARFVRRLLDAGHDPNRQDTGRWTQTRVDRVARVLALHRAVAAARGLPSEPLFADALASCISWFARLGGGERAGEWIRRLAGGGLAIGAGEGMALAEQDRALARFRGVMESVEGALNVVLDYEPKA